MIEFVGNDSGGECGVTVSRLFPMSGQDMGLDQGPGEGENGHRASPPFWFSYDYGSVHFSTLSSEHDLTDGSKQMKVVLYQAYYDSERDYAIYINIKRSSEREIEIFLLLVSL